MLFPTAECIVCSKSDNPIKKCRISDILSVCPIMNHIGDICRLLTLLCGYLYRPFFAESCTSTEAENSGCTI